MAHVSIVIPTLGRPASINDVLAALDHQKPPLQAAEVLVVLDAESRSLPPEESAGWSAQVRVLRAGTTGASAARNTGWRAAKGPIILFLDDDIVPGRQLVAEHLAWHNRHPRAEVGVLGLVRWSPQARVTPFMRWLEQGIQFDYGTIQHEEVGWQRFYSCNVSVKREMLERVGGFDEQRFPFGYEDLELAKRMSAHGFKLLYNPVAVAEHLKTETLESWRRNLRRIAQAERRFTQLYPEVRPYFYERFRVALEAAPARGRSARLARFVHPGLPWLGKFVWRSFDLVCSQALAPEFMAEWEAAARMEER